MANIINLVAGVNEQITLDISPPLVDVLKVPSGFGSTDIIFRFNPDQDFIDVRAFPSVTASGLLTNSIEYTFADGPATRILGSFGSIYLRNVAKAALTTDNFIVTSDETTAPTALLQATNILADGVTTTHQFDVVYSDNTAINAIPAWTKDGESGSGSFDDFDVRVMGPNGFDALATFISVNPATDSSPVTVTYEIMAPGGNWDAPTDVGTYTVSVEANQVSDINGNTVAAGDIGTFSVGEAITIPAVIAGVGNFGFSLAANGTTNEFIVGAPTASLQGQAYRYVVPSTMQTTTYNSLSPTAGEFFGFAVDANGTNVLIGAPSPGNPGTAYQIPVGGAGGTTIPHPQPSAAGNDDDRFGTSVTFGSSGLLIGAPFDDVGSGASTVFNVGAAYLNGVTAFANPVTTGDTQTVLFGGEYGYSVTDAGANFLIGVPQWEADPTNGPFNTGRVHLVNNTGAVQLNIANPNPGPNSDDRFGFAVAANSDGTRLLIGAPGDDNEGLNAGRAYLYNNSGTLLETFTNPNTANRGFGGAVEFTSNGDILIGSPGFVDETNPPPLQPVLPDPGAAYLFTAASLDLSNATPPGPAQQTFTPPDPGDIGFGGAIAAVQNAMGTQDDIVIGAPFYPMPGALLGDVFPTAEGRVYLYDF